MREPSNCEMTLLIRISTILCFHQSTMGTSRSMDSPDSVEYGRNDCTAPSRAITKRTLRRFNYSILRLRLGVISRSIVYRLRLPSSCESGLFTGADDLDGPDQASMRG
jgi:hypothetical protein